MFDDFVIVGLVQAEIYQIVPYHSLDGLDTDTLLVT